MGQLTLLTCMTRFLYRLMPVVALLAAGCVQIEQDLTLKRDGTGVLRLTYIMAENGCDFTQQATQAMLRQTLAVSGGVRLPQDMSDAEISAMFAGCARDGVVLEHLTTERCPNHVIRRASVSFKTLSGLARALLPERTVALTRDARGNYVLLQQPGSGDGLVNRFAAVAAEESNPLIAELFKGFHASLRVTVPTRVLATNSTQPEQLAATWRFDYDQDSQALAKALQRPMRMTFEGHGLNLTPFVHQAGTP